MGNTWTKHLRGLAEIEDNIGKQVAFTASAEKIDGLEAENASLRARAAKWEAFCKDWAKDGNND